MGLLFAPKNDCSAVKPKGLPEELNTCRIGTMNFKWTRTLLAFNATEPADGVKLRGFKNKLNQAECFAGDVPEFVGKGYFQESTSIW